MRENLHILVEMARHDPAVIMGFLLIGTFAVLFIHIELKMREVGYKPNPFTRPSEYHALPFEYLRIRVKHGWSPWPAYLIWPCLAFGVALLVFGVAHLPD
jgi:hypothetical protein